LRKNLLVCGKTPPPVGGVTVFIKYFIEALDVLGDVNAHLFCWKILFKNKFNVVHINSSNSIKRLLLIVFFKVLGKKVFFVKHGGMFDLNNVFVKLSLKVADGVFCLNSSVKTQLDGLGVRNLIHSTVFKENEEKLRAEYPRSTVGEGDILFYINNSSVSNNEEVYGASFFCAAIKNIPKCYRVTVVDLSGDYKELFSKQQNITYHSSPINFCKALSEHKVYVRCTSKDGMSVALLEAGLIGTKCLASDAAERPGFVHVYKHNDTDDFVLSLMKLLSEDARFDSDNVVFGSVVDVVNFMFQ